MVPEEWPIAVPAADLTVAPARNAGRDRLSTVRVDFFLDPGQRLSEQERAVMTAMLHGLVAYHDFEGITIHADEAPRLLKNIGDKPVVILRNHGLLAWGRTLPLAFVRLWTLQRACEVQAAQAALGPAIAVTEAVAQQTVADSFQWDQRFGAGQDVFDALVRRVDRIDASYKN